MSIHNLCFEQIYEKYQSFLSDIFQFMEVKFSTYLNRHVLVMFWISPFYYPRNVYKNCWISQLLQSQNLVTPFFAKWTFGNVGIPDMQRAFSRIFVPLGQLELP